jgi:hypothetical protein
MIGRVIIIMAAVAGTIGLAAAAAVDSEQKLSIPQPHIGLVRVCLSAEYGNECRVFQHETTFDSMKACQVFMKRDVARLIQASEEKYPGMLESVEAACVPDYDTIVT